MPFISFCRYFIENSFLDEVLIRQLFHGPSSKVFAVAAVLPSDYHLALGHCTAQYYTDIPDPQEVSDAGVGDALAPQPLPLTGVLAPALAMGPSPGLPMGSPTVPSFCSTGMSLCHGSFKNCDFKLYLASFAELLGLAKKPSFPIFKVAKWFSPLYKYCLHITLVFGI